MLRCNKYPYNPQGEIMDCQSLAKRLRDCFAYKSDVEKYIESKNPKNAADVEHWLQEYTYQNHRNWTPNA